MEYISLMSGSWGNCHYIKAGSTSILVDAGQSGKRILDNMALAGCGQASDLSAIVVTHAHRDHVMGVGVLARRLGMPVYATEGAWYEMGALAGDIPMAQRRTIHCDETWSIGSLLLEAYPTSHDALESVGYSIRASGPDGSPGGALGIATDCGVFTSRMERVLRDAQALVLEANHDIDMLRTGHYPYYLKKRISGIDGHLSNEDACAALKRIIGSGNGGLRTVVLAHLSEENNTWEKALACVSDVLPAPWPTLSVAPRKTPGQWVVVA